MVSIYLVKRIVGKENKFNQYEYRVDHVVKYRINFNEIESEQEKPFLQLEVKS